MNIINADDYRDRVRQLPCLEMLAAHRVTVHCAPARDQHEFVARIADADTVVTLSDWLDSSPALLNWPPRLRLILPVLRSPLFIDIEACARRGALVVAYESRWPEGCAELSMALILGSLRDLVFGANLASRGEWPCALSRRLYGRTLGILGFAKVGRLVAQACQGLGMNILVWGRERSFLQARACGREVAAGKAELFERVERQHVFYRLHPALECQMMRQDPSREELQMVLRAIGIPDCTWESEEAIYWFANDHHAGPGSTLHEILCTSSYAPGPITRGPETTEGYDALRREFA